MQSTDDGNGDNATNLLHGSTKRRIFLQSQLGTCPIVIIRIR